MKTYGGEVVQQLEEKGLIYTEPTLVQSKDGKTAERKSLTTIRPIPGVLEAFYERQFRQAEEAAARYRAAQLLQRSNAQGRQNALCAFPGGSESQSQPEVKAGCEPFSEEVEGRKKKQDKRHGVAHTAAAVTSAWCGQFRKQAGVFERQNSTNKRQLEKAPCCRAFQRIILQQKIE